MILDQLGSIREIPRYIHVLIGTTSKTPKACPKGNMLLYVPAKRTRGTPNLMWSRKYQINYDLMKHGIPAVNQ